MNDKKIDVNIEIAQLEDVSGIHEALKQNLIEVKDLESLSNEQKDDLEKRGFLRKEVPKEYYENMIKDANSRIYVAKNNNGEIVGFASFFEKHFDVRTFRTTMKNLYTNDDLTRDLLTSTKTEFIYFDQISIIPDYKNKGVGTALIQKYLADMNLPIVSFVVKTPLSNIASVRWHEYNGFIMAATCDGEYKDEKMEWWIYINWNEK